MAVMPMFPLGSVLLPNGVLSLHVFEPRYRALVTDCVAAEHHEFGVVLIDRGSEVGGGDVRRQVGTVARMVQVAEVDDGRFAVIAVGVARMRVREWLVDDPYPLAEIDVWPDLDELPDPHEPPDLDELLGSVTQRTRRAAALAMELGDDAADPSSDIADDLLTASYQLAALAPIGPADVYSLLSAAGPVARLTALAALLDDVEAIQSFRLQSP